MRSRAPCALVALSFALAACASHAPPDAAPATDAPAVDAHDAGARDATALDAPALDAPPGYDAPLVDASVPDGAFALVATHPQAAMQRTAAGREIATLYGWQHALYAGYGDYGANTGPIAIVPFDPTARTFGTPFVSDTEAVDVYREIGSLLYAPAIDRRTRADYAAGEPWADHRPITTEHAFDIATLDGTDLYLVGSKYGGCPPPTPPPADGGRAQTDCLATVWRSTDGGTTWTVSLTEPPIDNDNTNNARYYFAAVYHGRLYVQASDFNDAIAHPASKVFDGTSWTDGPSLITIGQLGWHPIVFADRVVFQGWQVGLDAVSGLSAFDGTVTRPVPGGVGGVYDFTVGGPYLFALTGHGEVVRTTDLATWQTVAAAPTGARSVGVLDGHLFVGTAASQIYEYSAPVY